MKTAMDRLDDDFEEYGKDVTWRGTMPVVQVVPFDKRRWTETNLHVFHDQTSDTYAGLLLETGLTEYQDFEDDMAVKVVSVEEFQTRSFRISN